MSRNLVVTVVVILLIVLGAGAYMFMNKPAAPQAPIKTAAEPSVQPSPAMQKASLKSFMAMTGTQKCEFNDTDNGSSGTVYLNSGKVRGDFESRTGTKTTLTHMINDGKAAYIWMDDQATGFKTTLEAIEKTSGQTGVSQSVDINKQVDYKCESWNPEAEKFNLPADKKFNDMSKMMEDALKRAPSNTPGASSASEGDNSAACASCDNLEGDSKAQCKRALKCS